MFYDTDKLVTVGCHYAGLPYVDAYLMSLPV